MSGEEDGKDNPWTRDSIQYHERPVLQELAHAAASEPRSLDLQGLRICSTRVRPLDNPVRGLTTCLGDSAEVAFGRCGSRSCDGRSLLTFHHTNGTAHKHLAHGSGMARLQLLNDRSAWAQQDGFEVRGVAWRE
jgi:hypothetical protein